MLMRNKRMKTDWAFGEVGVPLQVGPEIPGGGDQPDRARKQE